MLRPDSRRDPVMATRALLGLILLIAFAQGQHLRLPGSALASGTADAPPDSAASAVLAWPIDAEPALTSGFAEQRPDHFHAGVDIKTWEGSGYAIRAAGDGHVWRIKTSPGGYGKALYLELDSGLIVVYAHLLDFAEPIRSAVEEEQWRRRSYSIDLSPPPDQIPIHRGEVIGRTGRSGCRWPHLHFELRNADNHPVNPLTHGLALPDRTPPAFEAVAFIPIDHRSTVNGASDVAVLRLQQRKDGLWTPAGGPSIHISGTQGPGSRVRSEDGLSTPAGGPSIHISGTLGVAVKVWDRACGVTNTLPVYRVDLYVDDTLHYATAYDEFSYGETRQVDIEYDYPLYREGWGSFRRLFRSPGHTLSFPPVPGDGQLRTGGPHSGGWLSGGEHTLEIVAEDASGNEARCTLPLLVNAPPRILDCTLSEEAIQVRAADPDQDSLTLSFAVSADLGRSWRIEIPLRAASQEEVKRAWRSVHEHEDPPLLARVIATDSFAASSAPVFRPIAPAALDEGEPPEAPRGIAVWPSREAPETTGRGASCLAEQIPPRIVFTLLTELPLAVEPEVTLRQRGGPRRILSLRAVALDQFRGEMELDARFIGEAKVKFAWVDAWGRSGECDTTLQVQGLTRERGGTIVSSDRRATISVEPGGVYADLIALVETEEAPYADELRPASRAYTFGPDLSAFPQDAEISIIPLFKWARADTRIGIFAFTREWSWEFVGRDRDGDRVTAPISRLGTYAVLQDTVAPRIWALSPEADEVVGRDVRVRFRASDGGSGIEEDGIDVWIDETRMVAEWDPFEERVVAWMRGLLRPGDHLLSIEVEDALGNRSAVRHRFSVE
jgi:hypothetical protein